MAEAVLQQGRQAQCMHPLKVLQISVFHGGQTVGAQTFHPDPLVNMKSHKDVHHHGYPKWLLPDLLWT